ADLGLLCRQTRPPGYGQEPCAQAEDWRSARAIYDFHALDIDGNDVSLERYRFLCLIPVFFSLLVP
uniref:Uncharacterized protein n=1 Tax=Anas zonorhyncha TaxID=75864 RepID=A0A8B9VB66_9AVES